MFIVWAEGSTVQIYKRKKIILSDSERRAHTDFPSIVLVVIDELLAHMQQQQ